MACCWSVFDDSLSFKVGLASVASSADVKKEAAWSMDSSSFGSSDSSSTSLTEFQISDFFFSPWKSQRIRISNSSKYS